MRDAERDEDHHDHRACKPANTAEPAMRPTRIDTRDTGERHEPVEEPVLDVLRELGRTTGRAERHRLQDLAGNTKSR